MTNDEFLKFLVPAAVACERQTTIPAEATVAQAIWESGWGQSKLAVDGKNLFGIKDQDGDSWHGPFVLMKGWEVVNGQDVWSVMKWRKYDTWEGSLVDHAQFFKDNSRYAKALLAAKNPGNWVNFLRLIHAAGYATDPTYSDSLMKLVKSAGIDEACQAERQRQQAATPQVEAVKVIPPPTHWAAQAAVELNALGVITDPDPAKLYQPVDRGTLFAVAMAVIKHLASK